MITRQLTDTKTLLAKLLAGENITVLHEPIPTAFFDLKNRILHCPNWENISAELHDLLKGHEVGHALYTPEEGWHNAIFKCRENHEHQKACLDGNFKQFLNVCEDARIERKIKNKFPGLRRSFVAGYKQLWDRNFFGARDINVNKLNLIDRINLYFKVGAVVHVKFTESERKIIKRLEHAETFQEIVTIAREVYDICGKEQAKIQSLQDLKDELNGSGKFEATQSDDDSDDREGSQQTEVEVQADDTDESDQTTKGSNEGEDEDDSDDATNGGELDEGDEDSNVTSGSGEETDEDEDEESDSSSGSDSGDSDEDEEDHAGSDETDEDESEEQTDSGGSDGGRNETNETMSVTDKIFHDREKNLCDTTNQVINATLPTVNLNKIIYPLEYVVNFYEKALKHNEYEVNSNALLAFLVNKHKAHINLLIKEFEMRKNATQYARTMQYKTGELDMQRLAFYKFTNDIFRRTQIVPKGKSHGMIMYLDMSGSMNGSFMFHAVEQIIILVTFCQRVGIPYDVYGFADTRSYGELPNKGYSAKYSHRETDLDVSSRGFHLRQLISSSAKPSLVKRALRMLASYAAQHYKDQRHSDRTDQIDDFQKLVDKFFNTYHSSSYSYGDNGLVTSGTPLGETIVCSRQMIEDFKFKKRLDIVNVVYLTDGQGSGVKLPVDNYDSFYEQIKVLLTDPKTKMQVVGMGYQDLQAKLFELIKHVTGCRHIGYYICSHQDITFKINYNEKLDADQKIERHKELEKNGYYADAVDGFDTYYFITTKFMGYKEKLRDMFIGRNTTKEQLYKQFTEDQINKKAARIVLGKFAEEIANDIVREVKL